MSEAQLDWQTFEPSAFDRARREGRPVLLLLTVTWCAHCRELLRTSFAHPETVDLVQSSFVPVHVDAERRPDINERYGAGGWPTIAFLTPSGELIAHDGYLSPDELAKALRKVSHYFRENGEEIDRGLRELWSHKLASRDATSAGQLSMSIVEDVCNAMYEKFDHRFGGWGEGSKFPHPEAIDFALVQVAKRDDPRMKEVVTVTLDRMMESPIHDPIDGGFFRYSKTPDWQSPNYEKVLDANVQRLRCYLEAWQLLGKKAYRQTAEGVVRWMLEFMLDEEGAFFGSQDADPAYYSLDGSRRGEAERPRLDRTVYAHANAMAVSNLLKASVVLERNDLRGVAMRALHFLLEKLSDRDGEVYHYWDGTYHLPGLLSDQAYLIRALIDASQLTGDADLLLPAERVAENVIQRQRADGGGFWDILGDPSYQGSMQRRNRSILENSVMAEALMRLSYLSKRSEFYDEALRTLEAFTGDYKEYGYYVAGYGRAVDLVFYPPLLVTVVGDRESDATDALRRRALRDYVPSRIVQMLDPERDPVLLERAGYPAKGTPTVYLCVGRATKATVQTPDELTAKIDEIERERRRGA
ncbi:MAG: DUF255 domain-containing protein [Planctomycetota bacterium]